MSLAGTLMISPLVSPFSDPLFALLETPLNIRGATCIPDAVFVIVFLLIHGFVIGAVRPSANALLFPIPANKALSLCFTRTLIKHL